MESLYYERLRCMIRGGISLEGVTEGLTGRLYLVIQRGNAVCVLSLVLHGRTLDGIFDETESFKTHEVLYDLC